MSGSPLRWVLLPLFLLACAWPLACPGQDNAPSYKDRLPRIPPVEPQDALATFTVEPGYQLQQAAAEPLVSDPVAMEFDADGRLYVVEMRGYSEDEKDNLGVIRLLSDSDGDGRFDESQVFLDGLSWPTALCCWDGGVFIGVAPDVLYCKDTDGDGRADLREVVLTGFGRSNVQGLLNCFRWGLDNRIHLQTSSSGAQLVASAADPNAQPVTVRGRDVSFDPHTRKFRLESGGGQHGMCFDDWGRKFICNNSNHIRLIMYQDRYLARNPYLAAPAPAVNIATDGPAAEVFRTSPVEPWRIVRTELRVAGTVPGVVEGGGRAAGYFTGATGVTLYRGNAMPELRGDAFIGDVGSNLVHHKKLVDDGLSIKANRAEPKREFLSSRDIWFRPAQYANAPDGALYVGDVYREVIEHPKSLPPVIKQHLDLTSGRGRGRIYRVLPADFKAVGAPPRLSKAKTEALVALLEHDNAWHRETAARLLYERQDKSAVAGLVKLTQESDSPLGRMHALHTLDGLGALSDEVLLTALDDPHPRVREHAVLLSEALAGSSPRLADKLTRLTGDEDLHVRFQLAFSLGEFGNPASTRALVQLARNEGDSSWMQMAILSSAHGRMGELFSQLAADAKWRKAKSSQKLLATISEQVGLANRRAGVADVLKVLETLPAADSQLSLAVVEGLSKGLAKSGSSLQKQLGAGPKAGNLLGQLLDRAKTTAADTKQPVAGRVEAIESLGLAPFDDVRQLLGGLLDSRQPQAVQTAAVGALGRFREPAVADVLISGWGTFSPSIRSEAAEAIFARNDRLARLLDALESGQIRSGDLEPSRIKFLLSHPDAEIRSRSGKLLSGVKLARRGEVVESYRDVLNLQGNVDNGRAAFRKVCAACHKLEGVGHETGANLASVANRGAEFILLNVLDPNREVNPRYLNYVVLTTDGRALSGMISAETANSITLRRAEGATDTVLRAQIDELQSSGLSIMPEGLEKKLSKQDLADVIAYLLGFQQSGE